MPHPAAGVVAQAALAAPAASGVQVPGLPVTLQAAQVPHEALEQQTPSVHMALRHSPFDAQAAPRALRLVQAPDWQV